MRLSAPFCISSDRTARDTVALVRGSGGGCSGLTSSLPLSPLAGSGGRGACGAGERRGARWRDELEVVLCVRAVVLEYVCDAVVLR